MVSESLPISQLLRQHGLRPSKSLGQNFLTDDNILARIVEAAQISSGDTVLDVGPGLGSLTRHLAEAAEAVVAVELDKKLIGPLEGVLAAYENVRIVQGDILELSPADLDLPNGYVLAANIPYYITSALIRHLLEADTKPARLTLTVQKEVAQRMCAGPGDMSLLALSVQVYGQPEMIFDIPAGAFYPAPKVDSAVVRVALYDQPLIPVAHLDDFFRLTKAGFGQRRKTLRNALSSGLAQPKDEIDTLLEQANIDGQRRAETLNLEEWGKLVEEFSV